VEPLKDGLTREAAPAEHHKRTFNTNMHNAPSFSEVPIDAVRDFWNARPCNVRHSPQPVGTAEYFDEVERRKYFVEPHIVTFADFPQWRGKRVLEIGCGIGTATISFARAGADVTAVDLSSESLDLARKRAEVFDLTDRVHLKYADAENLSEYVRPATFDLIWSFGVLHHTPNPERAFNELKQYAAPGTTIKIMMYYSFSWKVLWAAIRYGKGRFWDWRQTIARHSEAQTGCPVTYTYTKRELTKLLADRGFRVTEIFVDHVFPYSIPEYVQYRYRKVWYFAWMPHAFFRWFERRFGWHLCVTGVAT
jgi:SAM-dependent methyltransferase